MFLSVLNASLEGADLSAGWRHCGAQDADAPLGTAGIGEQGADLIFALTDQAQTGVTVLGCHEITELAPPRALRVDEVAFPVGAIAHRHTHAGSGWRHLVSGSLRIETNHGSQIIKPGTSWFEPANSPVRAVALQTEGVTRFVRCMVIPEGYVGRSTFQLEDPKDADLPRLQVTHRHFDHVFQLDAG
ncbi:MAG: hypothetical protein JXR13_10680 [Thalassovita sp.]